MLLTGPAIRDFAGATVSAFRHSRLHSGLNIRSSRIANRYRSHARKCVELACQMERANVRAQYLRLAIHYLGLAEAEEARMTEAELSSALH